MALVILAPILPNSAPAFDPVALALTGWWRAPYTGLPWTGTPSAGSSGSHPMTSIGADPRVGVMLNGMATADMGTAGLSGGGFDLFDNTAGSFFCLFNAFTAPASAGSYSDGNILTDVDAQIGIGLTSAGFSASLYNGGNRRVDIACSTGAWHLGQVRWNGATLESRLDGGAWSSIACGGYLPSSGALIFGRAYAAASYFYGHIAELGTSDTVLTDATFDSIRASCNARYGLAL